MFELERGQAVPEPEQIIAWEIPKLVILAAEGTESGATNIPESTSGVLSS